MSMLCLCGSRSELRISTVNSTSALLLQPKTADSHRLKIHVLDNDVDKNVLKTSEASYSCEAGLTPMIFDCPMTVLGNAPPFIHNY